MATPYLIADSAQVTVLRSLASTAFGKYGLKLPEGIDLEDVYEPSAPGNEAAYVSSLGGKRRVGGMFRRFVRADVNVTAQGEDMVPASDVERVLDEAAKRVSGDFFLESDITKAGLGPWVPMVDFHVGDIANVEIWGRVVPLVVTRIEPKRTDHSDNDWSVHVGGQLLSDSEARLAENADIYNAVVSDRRELAGLDGKIRAETSNRKSAVAAESRARTEAISAEAQARALADSEEARARQKAISDLSESFSTELETYGRLVEEAKNSVDPATQQVVNFWSEENQNNFNKAVQLTLSAQSAYNDINNIKWVSQDAWNAQQEKINEARDKFEAQQVEIDAAQDEVAKANSELIKFTSELSKTNSDLLKAQSEVLKLIQLSNHGSWYLGDSYVLEANTWKILNFNSARGSIRNCSSIAVGEGRGIRLLEKGDWEIRLRVTLPPGNTVIGTSTAIRITVMPALGGTNIGRSKTTSFNQGWDETLTCSIVTSIPESGCYVYAEAFASTKSGANDWWPSSTGSELTEFTARQISF